MRFALSVLTLIPSLLAPLAAQGGDRRGETPDSLPPPLVVLPLPILTPEQGAATITLAAATTLELVEKLGHANGGVRDTAQRLLVERRDPAGVTALRATAIDLRKPPVARLHALWTLEGCGGGALDGMTLTAALADPDPAVVAAAVRLSEGLLKEGSNPDLAARVITLVQSRSEPVVRLQLARALGEINTPAADVALRDLVVRAGRQPLLADAVVSGLAGRENGLVEALVHSPAAAAQSGEVLRYATSAILKSGDAARIERVLGIIGAVVTPEWARIPMLSGVRHFLPKGPDGSSYPALLPAEPKPLVALAADPASPAALILQPLLAQLRWPGKPGVPAIVAPLTEPEQRRYDLGRQKFAVICATCHQAEGQGLGGIAPPLVESNRVLGDPRILVRIVLNGKIGSYLMMPPLKETLDDESVAGVLTFIRRSWGHEAGPVAPEIVREARAATADRHDPFSEEDLAQLAESLGR